MISEQAVHVPLSFIAVANSMMTQCPLVTRNVKSIYSSKVFFKDVFRHSSLYITCGYMKRKILADQMAYGIPKTSSHSESDLLESLKNSTLYVTKSLGDLIKECPIIVHSRFFHVPYTSCSSCNAHTFLISPQMLVEDCRTKAGSRSSLTWTLNGLLTEMSRIALFHHVNGNISVQAVTTIS